MRIYKILFIALVIMLSILPPVIAEEKVVHLSDILESTRLERCENDCQASGEFLRNEISKVSELNRSHLSGQLAIWKKSCVKACKAALKEGYFGVCDSAKRVSLDK